MKQKIIYHRYCLAVTKEMRNLLRKVKIYKKLDVQAAYNLFLIQKGDEYKLAFQMWYALFEPIVIQFEMTNASVDFQGYSHNALKEAFDDFASPYQDDIML